MRLVNTTSLKLESFLDEDAVPYAILSHRWEDEEVTFEDMRTPETAQEKKGWSKITNCCKMAKSQGFKYVWIDTCCIDKSSSAELSEAINSMFRYYQRAGICLAYLSDVGSDTKTMLDDFIKSAWFFRGWTLQELIAPQQIVFFNHGWVRFGEKTSLGVQIVKVSGIPQYVLNGRGWFNKCSIAQRMQWAAQRTTSRKEDRAYSLMGLFNINMPLLYGEGGKRAFMRLQKEIIKNSDDHSIFAWTGINSRCTGLLAPSPSSFVQHETFGVPQAMPNPKGEPYNMTNKGLSIKLKMSVWYSKTYLALLNSGTREPHADKEDGEDSARICIFLQQIKHQHFRRVRDPSDKAIISFSNKEFAMGNRRFFERSIYVRQDETTSFADQAIPFSFLPVYGVRVSSPVDYVPSSLETMQGTWNANRRIAELKPGQFGPLITLVPKEKSIGVLHPVIRIGISECGQLRFAIFRGGAAFEDPFKSIPKIDRDHTSTRPIDEITFHETNGWRDGLIEGGDILAESSYRVFFYQFPEDMERTRVYLRCLDPRGGMKLVGRLVIKQGAVLDWRDSRKVYDVYIGLHEGRPWKTGQPPPISESERAQDEL